MALLHKLNSVVEEKNWEDLREIIKPKMFPLDQNGVKVDRKIVAKLADILTTDENNLPDDIMIIILKCIINSCTEHGYKHKSLEEKINPTGKYVYRCIVENDLVSAEYPSNFFPYDDVITRTVLYLEKIAGKIEEFKILDDELEKMRIFIRFLCNVMAFSETAVNNEVLCNRKMVKFITCCLKCEEITKNIPLLNTICCFANNVINSSSYNFIQSNSETFLTIFQNLIAADKLEIAPAGDALLSLISKPSFLENIYDFLSIDCKLYVLEVIYQTLKPIVYEKGCFNVRNELNLSEDCIRFLSERFRKRSDLILKTEDTYLEGFEPCEVIILLDILSILTSTDYPDTEILRSDKSLFINAIFLLKAMHMAGKENNNIFTPIQKLSEVAPSFYKSVSQDEDNKSLKNNSADQLIFGFKSALIRLIGNLLYKNRVNQDLVRDADGISLILDCCNIDAKNPLITQWSILAIRNLLENNSTNQEFIKSSQKMKFIDSGVIREMGLTLNQNEEGEILGIVPLKKDL